MIFSYTASTKTDNNSFTLIEMCALKKSVCLTGLDAHTHQPCLSPLWLRPEVTSIPHTRLPTTMTPLFSMPPHTLSLFQPPGQILPMVKLQCSCVTTGLNNITDSEVPSPCSVSVFFCYQHVRCNSCKNWTTTWAARLKWFLLLLWVLEQQLSLKALQFSPQLRPSPVRAGMSVFQC